VTRLVLLGAGFSRNWGGWVASEAFEYLLGCPEIIGDVRLRQLLWTHQLSGGFESALAELQNSWTPSAGQLWSESQLIALQGAIGRMFDAMNRSFLELRDLEFQRVNPLRFVRTFLTKFDAIFTLNQDILLEQFYLIDNTVRATVRPYIPGMRHTPSSEPMHSASLSRASWAPRSSSEFRIQTDGQPFYKLHGSSEWFADDGHRVLIMGGAKQHEIGRSSILSWYAQQFEASLLKPGCRLMVVGYGFGDQHINTAIEKAVTHGLKLFVIDPAGAELAFKLNKTRQSGQIIGPNPLEDMLRESLIGGSRRPLSEIFGLEGAEFHKVMRFFD
jgi:hypothetical protein